MRIRSAIVDGHQFTRQRRGGYDAAEVDAVMARIADTLRDYEDQAEELESRISAAETAARVARQRPARLVADGTQGAHERATEIVQRAEDEAAQRRAEIASLLEAARSEAEELRLETERARAGVDEERAGVAGRLEAATRDATEVVAQAHRDADEIRRRAREETEQLLSAAVGEAERLRAEATDDAASLRDARLIQAETEIVARVDEMNAKAFESAAAAERTASALAAAEAEREALESRLAGLRTAVRAIEHQMRALAGDLADRAATIGELADDEHDEAEPGSDPMEPRSHQVPLWTPAASDFQAPPEHAPLATAEPNAVVVVVDDTAQHTVDPASEDTHTYTQHHAYAEPDGSGRPPAERATIVPEGLATGENAGDDHHDPYRTVYQRAGRNLRARLRQEGQDPTQRGR